MAFVQIGLPIDANTIRAEAGQIALGLHQVLERGVAFKANFLDRYPDADFIAVPPAGPGFVAGDVTILKSAFTDFAEFYDLAHGNATLVSAKDFFIQLGKLRGPKS